MSAWAAIRGTPSLRSVVKTESPLVNSVFKLEKEGYWAEFKPRADGSVCIRSFSGKFETECHGEAYTRDAARGFYRNLLKEGFTLNKES